MRIRAAKASKCGTCGLRWKPGHVCPAGDLDAAFAAYLESFQAGDSDAFTGLPRDSSRHQSPSFASGHWADRNLGYSDGYSQETARQQGAQS